MEKTYIHRTEYLVRDYECDLQGVVNNAVYLHYLEHARHELLHAAGVGFVKLHDMGIDAVLTRMEIDYRYSLKSRDLFVVATNVRMVGRLRFVFEQDIYRLPDERLIANALAVGTCLQNGRPVAPTAIVSALEAFSRNA